MLAFLALSGCASARPVAYLGPMQPIAGTCEPQSRAVLTIEDAFVHFTPREGVTTLDGKVSPDGAILAEGTVSGMDHRPYPQRLTARLAAGRVTGFYVTPRCRYALTLSAGAP